MTRRVAIVGAGATAFRPVSPELSYKELMYEAAIRAYSDAGIDPRVDVDSFVTSAEDFHEGTSIFDEYTPDQLGGVLRPNHTITADGLNSIAAAYMQILTGEFDMVVVEAHSKASNSLTPEQVAAYALDPVYTRPLRVHPNFIAGIEMNRFLNESGYTREHCAQVCVKNHKNALANPLAAYGASIELQEVLVSPPAFAPLSHADIARHADGAVVIVLASEERASQLSSIPIWVKGVGWCSDTPALETRDWGQAVYARLSSQMAYRMADIRTPHEEIDLAELDDSFSYKELQAMEALGLCKPGQAGAMTLAGETRPEGKLPVNISGGSLGTGLAHEATGLLKLFEIVLQLRGHAGPRQLQNPRIGVAQSWKGIPHTSGAVVVLGSE